jgi:hypothetical protein
MLFIRGGRRSFRRNLDHKALDDDMWKGRPPSPAPVIRHLTGECDTISPSQGRRRCRATGPPEVSFVIFAMKSSGCVFDGSTSASLPSRGHRSTKRRGGHRTKMSRDRERRGALALREESRLSRPMRTMLGRELRSRLNRDGKVWHPCMNIGTASMAQAVEEAARRWAAATMKMAETRSSVGR